MRTALILLFVFSFGLFANEVLPEAERLKQLDSYWSEVSKAVGSGDFEAYQASCHPVGVLVSGVKRNSSPLAEALKRWKREFDDTKSGKMKASVAFKFSQRFGDATTAHETGMFLYTATPDGGAEVAEYIHFEALLVKHEGHWKIVMEYQKSKGTKAEYEAIK